MINLSDSDEILAMIVYDHEKKDFAILDNPDSWVSGKGSEISLENVGKFHKGLLELIASYLDSVKST